MLGRATITLGIGPHSSIIISIISLHQKKYLIITIIRLIINYLITTIIRLIIVHKHLL